MADEKENPASATAQMPRVRRRAPTIELKATEVAIEPQPAASADSPPETENSVPPHYSTEPPAYETGGTEPPDEPPSPSPPPRPQAAASQGFFDRPVIAGLGGGAVVLIIVVLLGPGGIFFGAANPPDQRLAVIETQLRDMASRPAPRNPETRTIEELNARVAQLEGASRRSGNASGTDSSEEAGKTLQATSADLARRAEDNATAIREARSHADAALAAADAARVAAEKNNVEALANRVAALERASKTLTDEVAKSLTAAGGDRPLRAAVAAQALRAAVERGDPFAAELAAAKATASSPQALTPLEPFAANGLPSATVLARQLSDIAPTMLKAVAAPAPSGGFLDRLLANAEKLVRIRPIDGAPGDEPSAVISRAQAKATRSDLSGAVAELKVLPPNVRAPADDWVRKAEARDAAVNASRRLVADAMAVLGKAAP